MQRKRLGNSDLDITILGFGAWAIGGTGWQYAWGPQNDDQSIAAIRRALDLGINWIDTAAIYGLGHSEEIVARALKGVAHKPFVFTKCGLLANEKGEPRRVLKADSIRRECEESLRRLEVDVIDLYQIHWPDDDIEDAWSELARLKEAGKVRHIGVSNFDVAQMERARKIAPVTSLQPPYSLVDRHVEAEILPFCHKNGIGVINYSPMYSGLLTGAMTPERAASLPEDDWRRRDPNFQAPRLQKNLKLVETLREIGKRHGKSPGEVAVAWTLKNPAVTAAIVGARSAEQVDGWVGAASLALDETDLARITTSAAES